MLHVEPEMAIPKLLPQNWKQTVFKKCHCMLLGFLLMGTEVPTVSQTTKYNVRPNTIVQYVDFCPFSVLYILIFGCYNIAKSSMYFCVVYF